MCFGATYISAQSSNSKLDFNMQLVFATNLDVEQNTASSLKTKSTEDILEVYVVFYR